MARAWTDSINSRQLHDSPILAHIDPEFEADPYLWVVKNWAAVSFQDHVDQLETECRLHPQVRMDIIDITATEHDMLGVVDVFMHSELSGHPLGTRRQVMRLMKWRKVDGKWWWYKLLIIPGANGATFEAL